MGRSREGRHRAVGRRTQLPSCKQHEGDGDRRHGVFYHSVKEKRIVGIVEVVKLYYPDPTDPKGRFGMVDFKAIEPVPHPVTLEDIKGDERLHELALLKQSRLSVVPIDPASWKIICGMGGVKP